MRRPPFPPMFSRWQQFFSLLQRIASWPQGVGQWIMLPMLYAYRHDGQRSAIASATPHLATRLRLLFLPLIFFAECSGPYARIGAFTSPWWTIGFAGCTTAVALIGSLRWPLQPATWIAGDIEGSDNRPLPLAALVAIGSLNVVHLALVLQPGPSSAQNGDLLRFLIVAATASSLLSIRAVWLFAAGDLLIGIPHFVQTQRPVMALTQSLWIFLIALFVTISAMTIRQFLSTLDRSTEFHQIGQEMNNLLDEVFTKREALEAANRAQHDALEQVRIERDFLDSLLESIRPDIVLVLNEAGMIVRCNAAMQALFGYAREELIGKLPIFLFPRQRDGLRMILRMRREAHVHGHSAFETELVDRYGVNIILETLITWIPATQLFIAIGRDVSQRVTMERDLALALRESDRLRLEFQTVFESVQDGLVMYDAQGQERHRNEKNQAGFAVPAIALHHTQTMRTQDSSAVLSGCYLLDGQPLQLDDFPVVRLLRTGEIEPPLTVRTLSEDGSSGYVTLQAVPLRLADGTFHGVLGINRDMTAEFRASRQNRILRLLAQQCSKALDETTIAREALDILTTDIGVTNCGLILRDHDRPDYARVLHLHLCDAISAAQASLLANALTTSPIAEDARFHMLQVLAQGVPHFNVSAIDLFDIETQMPITLPMGQLACVPLRVDGKVFGALMAAFRADSPMRWDLPEQEMLLAAADEIATALHRASLYHEAQQLAQVDPLTGLFNHRALQQTLRQEIMSAAAAGLPVSVIMLDVDHFRRFNETYGHDVGDLALSAVAEAIRQAVRRRDYPARYGGEEFTIVLPETSYDEAGHIAERVRQQIASIRLNAQPGRSDIVDSDQSSASPQNHDTRVSSGSLVPVTASLGFATFPTQASVPGSLLKAADLALYAAKHRGRNRVEGYSLELIRQGTGATEAFEALPMHANLEMAQAIINAIDLRDSFTAAHSAGVARYAVAMTHQLGLEELSELAHRGGLVHDIGKIGLPDTILNKRGPLDAEEWQKIRAHTTIGAEMLSHATAFADCVPIARWHHERLDGSGYPDGLRATQIPLIVRILSVADAFEAYTAERPYHSGRSLYEGVCFLRAEVVAGRFDSTLVEALIASLGLDVLAAQRDDDLGAVA